MRDVTELVELRDRAYEGGVELKNAIVNKTGKNVYDYLQMHVHKMTQAAQHGRINEFMDEVILFSIQFGLQIPRALLEGMTDMRKFDVVSRSYIIGVFS